jgi:hypothetical protein
MAKFRDSKEDQKTQKKLLARARHSLAILGVAFITHGSGRFLNLNPNPREKRTKPKKGVNLSKKMSQ